MWVGVQEKTRREDVLEEEGLSRRLQYVRPPWIRLQRVRSQRVCPSRMHLGWARPALRELLIR